MVQVLIAFGVILGTLLVALLAVVPVWLEHT